MKETWFKNAIGLIIGLSIGGCLVGALLFQVFRLWSEDSETLKTQNINTLRYEFKEETPSLNFMDRAKQLGATRIFVLRGADTAEHLGVGCDDSSGFDKLNAKYRALLDGSAQAVFVGRPQRYIFEIHFKHGKVAEALSKDIACGTCGAK